MSDSIAVHHMERHASSRYVFASRTLASPRSVRGSLVGTSGSSVGIHGSSICTRAFSYYLNRVQALDSMKATCISDSIASISRCTLRRDRLLEATAPIRSQTAAKSRIVCCEVCVRPYC
eukprot:6213811-Pleurochrysis_carterae.AAC.1